MMEPPSTLPPERVAAWHTLASGGSLNEAATAAAEAIGRDAPFSAGTVSRWLRQWRKEHGDDLFRAEAAIVRAEQTEAARQAAELMWEDLRLREARNCGVTASQIRARLLELLPTVGAVWVDRGHDGAQSPIPMQGPSGREVKALADAVARLLETAELLDGRPTRHTRRSVPSDQWAPPQLPAGGLSLEEKRAKVIDLRDRARQKAAGE